MSLEQFFSLQGYFDPYVLINPQSTILDQFLMVIRTSSSIFPPTLSKYTSMPSGYNFFRVFKTSYLLQFIVVQAPIYLAYLHFQSFPAIAQTRHPKFLAICTAIQPTAPVAAEITTIYFGFIFPISCSPKQAVSPDIPKTPKKSSGFGQCFGIRLSYFYFTTAYFCHPINPMTKSPTWYLVDLEKITVPTQNALITS